MMQATHHRLGSEATKPLDWTAYRRILGERQVRASLVVQHDDATPTGLCTSFFIRGILGPDAWCIFMR
jgi:hypothetical protein